MHRREAFSIGSTYQAGQLSATIELRCGTGRHDDDGGSPMSSAYEIRYYKIDPVNPLFKRLGILFW